MVSNFSEKEFLNDTDLTLSKGIRQLKNNTGYQRNTRGIFLILMIHHDPD